MDGWQDAEANWWITRNIQEVKNFHEDLFTRLIIAKEGDKKYQAKQIIEPEKLTISVGFPLSSGRRIIDAVDYCLHLMHTY